MAVLRHVVRLLAAAVVCWAPAPAAHAAVPPVHTTPARPAPVVLVGLPGLRADDLSPAGTPELWRLLHAGASGSLSVRAVRRTTCPADGWLTVNAGMPAALPGPDGCRFPAVRPAPAGGARVDGFDAIVAGNAGFRFGAQFGMLAASAAPAGCSTAVGPGAALALADPAGVVASYVPDPAAADANVLARCPLTVVDLGVLPPATGRADALQRADAEVARLTGALPAGAAMIVAGLADSGDPAWLRVALATGPGFPTGRLTSPATRQPGLAQLTDLTPTVLDTLGVPPAERLAGSVIGVEAQPGSPERPLRGQAVAADVQRDALVPFFAGIAIVLVGLVALAVWGSSRPRVAAVAHPLAIGLAAVPAATFLANAIPWWRATHPAAALAALVAAIAAALGAAACLGPWRRHAWGPPACVALVTAVLLALDVVTGSRLQLAALYGHSPLVAGRFYGFNNSTYAVFAVATLLLAAVLAHPVRSARPADPGRPALRAGVRAALAVGAVGAVAVVVDGWPAWGADFGGVLALVPAFALLALWVAGVRITLPRLALAGASAVGAVALIATLDWLRPAASRSHLGAFVQQVLDGGAADVLHRKAMANLHSFTDNYLSLLVPVAIGLVVVLLVRPGRLRAERLAAAYAALPTLRPWLAAATVAAVLGFAVNDSGATVPAMALTLGVPLALATILRAPPAEADGAAPAEAGGAAPGQVSGR
ncbi:MAG TPA: hypothetical protein VFR67_14345 [Pilimelia sp.]|nr:hypothetical protein [Pilimelia sp.]